MKRQSEHTLSVLYAWGMSRKLLTCHGHHESHVPVIEFKARPETQLTSRQKGWTNRDGERSSDIWDARPVLPYRCFQWIWLGSPQPHRSYRNRCGRARWGTPYTVACLPKHNKSIPVSRARRVSCQLESSRLTLFPIRHGK